jgi:hypothetical protein
VVIALLLGVFFYLRRRGKRTSRGDDNKYAYRRGELSTDGALSELETRPKQQHYELPTR